MKRPLFIVVLILLGTMAHPELARANFIDWLQEWSGPGPFKAKWISTSLTGCVQDRTFRPSPVAMQDKFHHDAEKEANVLVTKTDDYQPLSSDYHRTLRSILANPDFAFLSSAAAAAAKAVPAASKQSTMLQPFMLDRSTLSAIYMNPEPGPGHAHPPLLCGYFDAAFFKAEAQNDFNEVRAHFFDFGPSARFFDSLDIGVGAGVVTIQSRDSKRKNFETNRATLVPVRVVLRPVLVFVPDDRRQRWMGFVGIYFKETYISGRLNGAEFGASNSSYHVNGELVRSFGLNLDVTALVPSSLKLRW
jgi:hypothetical protein